MKLFKFLLAAIIALTPSLSSNAAGWLPLAEASSTPVSNACGTVSGTTVTFTSQGTGGANPSRTSIVTINWSDSTNAGTARLTAMTLGGISMSRAAAVSNGVANSNSEIWYVANPTGTTANIVATFATAVDAVTIEVYNLVGYIADPLAITVGTTSVSQLYDNKQIAIAVGSRTTNVSTSLSNLVNDFSSACGANLWGVHASQRLTGNNQTLTTALSPSTNNPQVVIAIWGSSIDCSVIASPFLARASGLDATHITAYTNLTCGLFTDGIWYKLDVLHIYATQNSTTALLNIVSSNYNGTANGSPTFVADRGYTGTQNSTTVYIDTNYNPFNSVVKFAAVSAHISSWQVTNGQDANPTCGATDGTNSYNIPRYIDDLYYMRINNSGTDETVANLDSRGHFIANRSLTGGANAAQGFINGSQVITSNRPQNGRPNLNFYSIGVNNGGIASGYGQQEAMISIGSGLTPTDANNLYLRSRTYMTAVGVP